MPFTSPRCRLAVLLALCPPVAGLAAVTAVPAAAAAAKTQSVAIDGFAFKPQVITVAPGTTVTWTNADEDPHTVVATDKSFHSSAMDTDERFSFTFMWPGEFTYFCSLHPHMTGRIVVKG
jgi:plastocyanin